MFVFDARVSVMRVAAGGVSDVRVSPVRVSPVRDPVVVCVFSVRVPF